MSISAHREQEDVDRAALEEAERISREILRPQADGIDADATYPATQIAALAEAGLMGIAISREYGGLGLSYLAQTRCFAALAEGCMATALIASQHQGCSSFVTVTPHEELRRHWLPRLANGTAHGANGFNFLNLPPERAPMRATPVAGGYRLNGVLPWVTAAHHSDLLAVGAVLPDGLQILVAIPLREDLAGDGEHISVAPSMQLMALSASDTTEVRCRDYFVPLDAILLGPGEKLLQSASRGAMAFVPTAMAVGHARSSLAIVDDAAGRKGGPAVEMAAWLRGEIDRLDDAVTAALTAEDFERAPALRGRGNALAQRAAHLALIASGGAGYRSDRTPQRLYREAGFFSVWSVGGAIIPETLAHLIGNAADQPE
jgi:alkylation response protein AidB-like acyl-CoA dehydrogenase